MSIVVASAGAAAAIVVFVDLLGILYGHEITTWATLYCERIWPLEIKQQWLKENPNIAIRDRLDIRLGKERKTSTRELEPIVKNNEPESDGVSRCQMKMRRRG